MEAGHSVLFTSATAPTVPPYDAADAMIRPRLSDIAAMDYHRAAATIAEGERAAQLALPMIQELLGMAPAPAAG